MNTLPTLYKKTSTGAIQKWTIVVYKQLWHDGESIIGSIETVYGQIDTDKPQRTVDNILKGKNQGKKNETSAYDQAILEATAKWEKQKKKGYVETVEAAEAGEVDALIEGGVLPMLALKYLEVVYNMRPGHENDPPQFLKTKDSKKIKFPCFIQPKLDGIRCLAVVENGKCTLWSRTRKQIHSMPHIVKAIEALPVEGNFTLDGELYNHAYKHNFETIVSLVRPDEPVEGHELVQYHIYDFVDDHFTFEHRGRWLISSWQALTGGKESCLQLVATGFITEDKVLENLQMFRKDGYEGLMLRNSDGKYVGKRSPDLQKVKEFQDDEFDIVGVKEGRGKLQGHAIFMCLAKNGKDFDVKLEGDTAYLKQCFENHDLWEGKQLTVRYQGLTVAEQVPRFPVGMAIRDYE